MAEMCGLLLCPRRRRRIQRSLSAVVRTLALNAADGRARAGGRTRGRREVGGANYHFGEEGGMVGARFN